MSVLPPTGPTQSTNEILETMRSALLDFENANGGALKDIIGDNLYRRAAPAGAPYPYGVMRLSTRRTNGYSGLRLSSRLELQLYGRTSAQGEDISDAGDLCEQAMLSYVNASNGGLSFTADVQRDELPEGGAPVDSETCVIRIAFSLAIWPAYLTSLTT